MGSKRFTFLAAAFGVAVSFLLGRLMYISVFKNNEYSEAVSVQQTNVLTLGKMRGDIYDRNGIRLTGLEKTYYGINSDGEITSAADGVVSFQTVRRYGNESVASHIIGYTNSDGEGVCGVEKLCNDSLRSDGNVEVAYKGDIAGCPFDDTDVSLYSSGEKSAKNVWLTLDSRIQSAVEDVMDKSIPRGAVVILDTDTFEITAMASRPDYNRNNPEHYFEMPDAPLMNRAICQYNAGSIFKIAVTAASLDNNMEYADRLFYCHGHSESDGKNIFRCHKPDGHGLLDYKTAFAQSCNCAFYETGLCTGGWKICHMAEKLGMGAKHLGMENEEASGYIPFSKTFTDLQLKNISIGQGEVMITPLQCAVMTSVIANGGKRCDVGIVKALETEEGITDFQNGVRNCVKVMEEETANEIGKMMRECVLSGTGMGASDCKFSVAGKTGSAETGWEKEDGTLLQHGWFCGFFPYENPKYAMAILCEDGKSGAKSCVEPFVEICNKIYEIYFKNSRN